MNRRLESLLVWIVVPLLFWAALLFLFVAVFR